MAFFSLQPPAYFLLILNLITIIPSNAISLSMEGSSHDSQGKRIASHPTMQSNRGSLPDNDDVGEGQHGRMDDLTKNSLKELRGRLQQEATAYLEQERRVIINEELNKLREHRFLQRTMEEFNAADGHHHRWLREHQRVMDVMHKVRERS